jgi:hypothetical protein
VVDRSADACFAPAKQERDLGGARRLDVVLCERLADYIETPAFTRKEHCRTGAVRD